MLPGISMFNSLQLINVHCGFHRSLAAVHIHQLYCHLADYLLFFRGRFPLTNILLIKSTVLARHANRHSCVSAGSRKSSNVVFGLWSRWMNRLLTRTCSELFQPSSDITSHRHSSSMRRVKKKIPNKLNQVLYHPTAKHYKQLRNAYVYLANNPVETRQVLPSSLSCHSIRPWCSHKQETLTRVDSGRRALYTSVRLQRSTLPTMFRPPQKQMDKPRNRIQMTPISYHCAAVDS